MDELEILKKDWKTRTGLNPSYSYETLYTMLFKKSTSIVKWIFIISIMELVFWLGIYFITPKSTYEILVSLGADTLMIYLNSIHYIIVFGFIYYFYKNYTSIKVTDNTTTLMSSILKTRKTVRNFVIYNLIAFAVTILIINGFYYTQSDLLIEIMSKSYGVIEDKSRFLTYFFTAQIIFSIVMILLLALFYRIVYGILLKKLKRNYLELQKINE